MITPTCTTHSFRILRIVAVVFLTVAFLSPMLPAQAAPAYELRNLSLSADALNYDRSSEQISRTNEGLLWQADATEGAYLTIPRPYDWDKSSPIALTLYFTPQSTASGQIDFTVRVAGYNPGDTLGAGTAIDTGAVAAAGLDKVAQQTFTIQAGQLGGKSLWEIGIRRGGSQETFLGDVILLSVDVSYYGNPSSTGQNGLPANALNFATTNTALNPDWRGVQWQPSNSAKGYLTMPRPNDWDTISDVTVRLYFYPLDAGSGSVSFAVRPRSYNLGDVFTDPSPLNATPVAYGGVEQVRTQTFTVSAASLDVKQYWVFGIERGGAGETYSGEVVLMAVEINYGRMVGSLSPIAFPGNGLNVSATNLSISMVDRGLQWQANDDDLAYLVIQRPPDWTGTSTVILDLYFIPTTASAGTVSFAIRPQGVMAGETFGPGSSIDTGTVLTSGANKVLRQNFTISYARFGADDVWVIPITRGGSHETYTDDVILLGVGITYGYIPESWDLFLPLLSR